MKTQQFTCSYAIKVTLYNLRVSWKRKVQKTLKFTLLLNESESGISVRITIWTRCIMRIYALQTPHHPPRWPWRDLLLNWMTLTTSSESREGECERPLLTMETNSRRMRYITGQHTSIKAGFNKRFRLSVNVRWNCWLEV